MDDKNLPVETSGTTTTNTTTEVEEEKIDIDLGDPNTFFVANDAIYFGIAFDKLFDMPNIKIYDTFEMTSKRNFKHLAPAILETYQDLFLEEGKLKEDYELIFFKILYYKSIIMAKSHDGIPLLYDEFIGYLDDIMNAGDRLLIRRIDEFVNSNYALNLDEITREAVNQKKRVNKELQFCDEHARELLKIAYLYRTMIPIISVYFYYNKNNFITNGTADSKADNFNDLELTEKDLSGDEDEDEMKFDEVNTKVFDYLFKQFSKDPEALKNKLYRIANTGVAKTNYSDKRFWTVAKNAAITDKTVSLDIYKKLLTNAIPKLSIDGDKNVVSFLQAVINNQVGFLFQIKFKDREIPVGKPGTVNEITNISDDSDEGTSEFERIEMLNSQRNEGTYVLRKLNISETITKIPEYLNVGVSDAEVKDILPNIERNAIQEEIIALITFKYFEDTQALKYINLYQYGYLLIACRKYLEMHKFIYLPKILMAKCEKHRERLNISGKKVRPAIINSKKYNDLVKHRYPAYQEELDNSFFAFVGTVYSSEFKDKDGNEIFDSTLKVAKIANEMVDLIAYSM